MEIPAPRGKFEIVSWIIRVVMCSQSRDSLTLKKIFYIRVCGGGDNDDFENVYVNQNKHIYDTALKTMVMNKQ